MMHNIGGPEIILIVEDVSRVKGISKEAVFCALEDAVRVAARRKYGSENSIKAEIDRRTGEIKICRQMLVVSDDYDPEAELESEDESQDGTEYVERITKVTLSDARKFYKTDAQEEEILTEELPALDLGRVAAQSAKHVIGSKIKEAERERNYIEFQDRVGKIVSGIVEKVEREGITVKVGSAEALIQSKELPIAERKRFKHGDRIRALVYEVSKEGRMAQILLSRSHEQFVAELFAQEVPEIYDNLIQIKGIARIPGARTKIAVASSDPGIDPVGSCVGIRGSRVQAVINELGGEKIDVIEWSMAPATTVINALSPAEVSKVIIDEESHKVEVVVPEEQLSIAIGRGGQNVRLASKLLGWDIDVLSEHAESQRRAEEFAAATQQFVDALDVEEILAQLLVSEGYGSVQEIADASVEDVAAIEGLDQDVSAELILRAKEYAKTHIDAKVNVASAMRTSHKLPQELISLSGVSIDFVKHLVEAGIDSVQALADLSGDELTELLPPEFLEGLDSGAINDIIMVARQKVYFD